MVSNNVSPSRLISWLLLFKGREDFKHLPFFNVNKNMDTVKYNQPNSIVIFRDLLKCYDGLTDLELRFFTVYENNTMQVMTVTPIINNTFITINIISTDNIINEDLPNGIIYLKDGDDFMMSIYNNNVLLHTELIKVR